MGEPLLNYIRELVSSVSGIHAVNREIYGQTGIRNFFLSYKEIDDLLTEESDHTIQNHQIGSDKEFGDFQTSIELASKICAILLEEGFKPDIVIEPTAGRGNFILSVLRIFRNIQKVVGIEIQSKYVRSTKLLLLKEFLNGSFDRKDIEILQDDIFVHKFDTSLFNEQDRILIIGNPPWVTNSELEGKNLPKKSNFKRNNGLDAMTGKGNFDISEYIILHLLREFKGCNGKLALLCKTQVVKNILQFLPATGLTASNFRMFLFDAKKEFNASVEACLFIADLDGLRQTYQCKVCRIETPNTVIRTFGWIEGQFVSDTDRYRKSANMDGHFPLVWRSGIKHDCSKVMELRMDRGNILSNGLGEEVSVEPDLVYPLLKSSQLKGLLIHKTSRRVIVTQSKPGQDTSYIREKYPRLWAYLVSHRSLLDKRKSSIYENNPPFSIFGVGEYSFSPYKIAISGLYKTPGFSLVTPIDGKPVMLDDSCYLLGLDSEIEAFILLALLNSELVQEFLRSVVFVDAKRPYTKDILMRIDLFHAVEEITFDEVSSYLESNELYDLSERAYEEFLIGISSPSKQPEQLSLGLVENSW